MTGVTSPSRQRRYGASRVCRIWGVSRATLYRHRQAEAANDTNPPRRRGPVGACGDTDLLAAIRAVIEASPFLGEGYPQGLGAAALPRHPHGGAPCPTAHEGARPARPAPASAAGCASA